jgi:hypothetical protein
MRTAVGVYLAVLYSRIWELVGPYFGPVGREVPVAINSAHTAYAVALIVFFASLFWGEGEAAQHFLEAGSGFKHYGGVFALSDGAIETCRFSME